MIGEDSGFKNSDKIGAYVRIIKRGNIWYANFQLDGKQRRVSLKTHSKKHARDLAIKIDADLQRGLYEPTVKAPAVAFVIEAYIASLRSDGKAKKTLQKVDLVTKRVLNLAEKRKARSLLDIDLAFMDAYKAERANSKRGPAAPKTVLNEAVIIRQIVNFALARKLITTDPLAGLKLKKTKPSVQPCWTKAEVDSILSTSAGWQADALSLLAESGMRVGELKWLTWQDVDFDRNVIHIRAKPGWSPKTGDQRAIPISEGALGTLQRLPRCHTWVFTATTSRKHPECGRQISETRLLRYLKGVLRKLGLPGHLHTFRHAFISNAVTRNVAEAIIRSWVGHVDAEILRLYTHINDQASQSAMRAMNRTVVRREEESGDVDQR